MRHSNFAMKTGLYYKGLNDFLENLFALKHIKCTHVVFLLYSFLVITCSHLFFALLINKQKVFSLLTFWQYYFFSEEWRRMNLGTLTIKMKIFHGKQTWKFI